MSSPSGPGHNNLAHGHQGATPGPSSASGPLDETTPQSSGEFAQSSPSAYSDSGEQASAQRQGSPFVDDEYSLLPSLNEEFDAHPAGRLSESGGPPAEFRRSPNDFIGFYRSAMIYKNAQNQLSFEIAKQDTRFHLDLTRLMFSEKSDTTFIVTEGEKQALLNAGLATFQQQRYMLNPDCQPEGSPWKQEPRSAAVPANAQFSASDNPTSGLQQQQPMDIDFPNTCDEFITKLRQFFPERNLDSFTAITTEMKDLMLTIDHGDENKAIDFFMQLYFLALSLNDSTQAAAWPQQVIEAERVLLKFDNPKLIETHTLLLRNSDHLEPFLGPLQAWRDEQAERRQLVGDGTSDAPIEL
ncbi:hypothetical protein K491DRAFT_710484 [Lophiostoma macrostomum CBS 122681]|uniref:Uncharacterized protein n=1 Tax=Lophiostoma macrostomum CBS 122681 TaxID=1314788 RepID=A0A6A6TTX2_9PLEO|nr:hypothetical protein K491DRAFT_710484 [Lophiostoma macrostomum CBS 122681]